MRLVRRASERLSRCGLGLPHLALLVDGQHGRVRRQVTWKPAPSRSLVTDAESLESWEDRRRLAVTAFRPRRRPRAAPAFQVHGSNCATSVPVGQEDHGAVAVAVAAAGAGAGGADQARDLVRREVLARAEVGIGPPPRRHIPV